jgi:hypothetical protein
MPTRSSTRPRDPNQLAKRIIDIATGEAEDDSKSVPLKNPAAVALGQLGGRKGGKARAERLTPQERVAIAKKAAETRWRRKRDTGE